MSVVYRSGRGAWGLGLGAWGESLHVIDNALIVEIKSAERLLPIHTAQVLTYLRLVNIRHGLLMNFNVPFMKDGVKSILNASAPRIPDRQIVADAGASHVDGRPTGRD